MLQLRPATLADLDLLEHWHRQPHVIAAAGEDWGWPEELAQSPAWRTLQIAELHGRPIGLLQIIDAAEEESHYWGDVPPGLRAIDLWLGELADTGKGHGTRMMELALQRCFADPLATAVVVDPRATNTGARRFYERLGFVDEGPRRFDGDDEDCHVYRLRRADWKR
jgi:aminoglycoside 6'-N-acetyltransferase